MADRQTPEPWQRLEHLLAVEPHEEPAAALRGRVLDSVRAELGQQRSRSGWRMLAVAAAVLVWLNLSLSAANATRGPLRPREPRESVDRIARQIERLLPDLLYEEALRQAVLYRSGSDLVGVPQLPARPVSSAADAAGFSSERG